MWRGKERNKEIQIKKIPYSTDLSKGMAEPNPFGRLRCQLQDEATGEKGIGGRAAGEKVI